MEVRAGMKNDLTNPVVAFFRGPGVTGGVVVMPLSTHARASVITFQAKMRGQLQVNGIKLETVDGMFSIIRGRSNIA